MLIPSESEGVDESNASNHSLPIKCVSLPL